MNPKSSKNIVAASGPREEDQVPENLRRVVAKSLERLQKRGGRKRTCFPKKCIECGTWFIPRFYRSICCSRSCAAKRTWKVATPKHGQAHKTAEYTAWASMLQRCYNSKIRNYSRYGARGIVVCERWKTFMLFYEDMGKRPTSQHSIERINNDGNYEPLNCKWATRSEQCRNKANNRNLTLNGVTKNIAEWAEILNVNPDRLHCRKWRGWTDERTLDPSKLCQKLKT